MKIFDAQAIDGRLDVDQGAQGRRFLRAKAIWHLAHVDVAQEDVVDVSTTLWKTPPIHVDGIETAPARDAADGDVFDQLTMTQQPDKSERALRAKVLNRDVADGPLLHALLNDVLRRAAIVRIERHHIVIRREGRKCAEMANHAALAKAIKVHAILVRPGNAEIEADIFDDEILELAGADGIRIGIADGEIAQGQMLHVDEVDRHAGIARHLVRPPARIVFVVSIPDAAIHRDVRVATRHVAIGEQKQTRIISCVVGEPNHGVRVGLNRRARIQQQGAADLVSARGNENRAPSTVERALQRRGVIGHAVPHGAHLLDIHGRRLTRHLRHAKKHGNQKQPGEEVST